MRYPSKHLLWLVLIIVVFTSPLIAQNEKKKRARIQTEYVQDYTGTERLVANLKIRDVRYVPYAGAEIGFFSVVDTAKVLLDKVRTNADGEAIYILDGDYNLYRDESGLMSFEIEFAGDSIALSDIAEVAVKPVHLKTSFLQEDTIKYISVEASEIEPDETTTAIEGLEVFIFIKGTFSLLNIGEGETDQDGTLMINFPVEMPGDTAGQLTIVSQIQDNDIYGNVESRGIINWGIPVPLKVLEHRGLGDTDAPLWMVYTLIILLSAVWFHYLYVIFLIIKIKLSRAVI